MSTGKQDDADHATTRHVRSAMTALDKIAAMDLSHTERAAAMLRILRYARTLWEAEDTAGLISDEPREVEARAKRWEEWNRRWDAEREGGASDVA